MPSIEYSYLETATAALDVEDLGNVCIEATNVVLYHTYYLILRTADGWTQCITYGPIHTPNEDEPDGVFPDNISYTYSRFEYSAGKICGIIDRFLNNKNLISQAKIVKLEDILSNITNLVDILGTT